MAKCYECNKVYKGGKGWQISKGRFTTYYTCPECRAKSGTDLPDRLDVR
jgi:hypothetical protein